MNPGVDYPFDFEHTPDLQTVAYLLGSKKNSTAAISPTVG